MVAPDQAEHEPEEFRPNPDDEPAAFDPAAYRSFSLRRLRQLASLRHQLAHEIGADADLRHRLVDYALYSAYRDCASAGAEMEAREIIEQAAAGDR